MNMGTFIIGVSMVAILFSMAGFLKFRYYKKLKGKIVKIVKEKINQYYAVIKIEGHGTVDIPFENSGIYKAGQKVTCIFDNRTGRTIIADLHQEIFIGSIIIIIVLFVVITVKM